MRKVSETNREEEGMAQIYFFFKLTTKPILSELMQRKPIQLFPISCHENDIMSYNTHQSHVINKDSLTGMARIHALYVGGAMSIEQSRTHLPLLIAHFSQSLQLNLRLCIARR